MDGIRQRYPLQNDQLSYEQMDIYVYSAVYLDETRQSKNILFFNAVLSENKMNKHRNKSDLSGEAQTPTRAFYLKKHYPSLLPQTNVV